MSCPRRGRRAERGTLVRSDAVYTLCGPEQQRQFHQRQWLVGEHAAAAPVFHACVDVGLPYRPAVGFRQLDDLLGLFVRFLERRLGNAPGLIRPPPIHIRKPRLHELTPGIYRFHVFAPCVIAIMAWVGAIVKGGQMPGNVRHSSVNREFKAGQLLRTSV